MTGLTRRTVLAGATAVPAASTLPAIVNAGDTDNDPVVALAAELKAAWAKVERADEQLGECLKKIPPHLRVEPLCTFDLAHQAFAGLIKNATDYIEATEEGVKVLEAELSAVRRRKAAQKAAGLPRIEQRFQAASEEVARLELAISNTEATTLKGAMAQIVVAISYVDLVRGGSGDREVHQDTVERLLFSALTVLARETGAKTADLIGLVYRGETKSPFVTGQAS